MIQLQSQAASAASPRQYFGRRLRNVRRITMGLFKKLQQKINVFDRRQKRDLVLDIIGNCNLRCPSCPVGHMGQVNPSGLMDQALFAQLIAKANREYKVTSVSLFNWTEPLLNPQLPELIDIVNRHYLKCNLSSNLNVLKDNIDDILIAGPHRLRISLSGFTQPVYSRTHVGGNIERVKDNMKALAAALRRTGARTIVSVYYHKYKNNIHEAGPMREYAESLGFEWQEDWAYYMGTEKLIEYMDGGLNPVDTKFLDNEFALPIRESLEAAMQFRDAPCKLLKSQLVLDLEGKCSPLLYSV